MSDQIILEPPLFSKFYLLTGNGQIDFDEFVNLMTSKMKEMSRDESEMREAFKVFDRNGDGKHIFR